MAAEGDITTGVHRRHRRIDDAIVVAGSFNYTGPANDYNDENLSYAHLPRGEGGPTDLDRCAEITAFFWDEIDRIIPTSATRSRPSGEHGQPMSPINPHRPQRTNRTSCVIARWAGEADALGELPTGKRSTA